MRTTSNIIDPALPFVDARNALTQVLEQVHQLLSSLSQSQYVSSPVGPVHSAISSHVRHTIDHVQAWLAATETETIDYEHRERGTVVERERDVAIATIRALIDAIKSVALDDALQPWAMRAQVTENGSFIALETTPLREIIYVLSHTIHHNALIGVMARVHGAALPNGFGYAPATLTYNSTTAQTCAH